MAILRDIRSKFRTCYILGFYLLASLAAHSLRYSLLPSPLPESILSEAQFSADAAITLLRNITTVEHPINSYQNEIVRETLRAKLLEIQAVAERRGRVMEVLDDDFVGLLPYTKVGRPAEFVRSSNILVRLRGKSPENEYALLISAHYDSVATGFGVGDNGIGVVVAIEVVHALLYYEKLRFDVILNIGNGEEYGYFSSRAFTAHAWFKDVKAFINLDAVSAKGKSMLTRSSSYEMVRIFSGHAPNPHSVVLAQDLLTSGFVNSDTDFSVYFEAGLPGIDFAFYESRDVYHTPHDNIESIFPPNMQQLGANILAFVKALSNMGLLKHLKVDGESDFFHGRQTLWSGVFYDIFGLWNFHLSSEAFIAFQSVIFVALLFITTCAESGFASQKVWRKTKIAVSGFSRISSILLVSFLMSSLLNYLVTCLNPAVISGRPFVLPMFSFWTSLFCAELVITLIVRYRWWGGEFVDHYESLLSGVSLLWTFVLVFGIYTLSVHIALVSVYVWFGLCWLIVYGISECSLISTVRLQSNVTDSIQSSEDDNACGSNGPGDPQESDISLSENRSSDDYAAQTDPLLESEAESDASDVEEQPHVISPMDDTDSRCVYRGLLIAISASLFPSIFYLDISESLIHAIYFMVQEGVSPLIYAVLYPIWYSALIVNFIPVLFIMTHNATQNSLQIFIFMCGAISLGILITACLIFPFADHTYMKLSFSQQYFFNHTFTPSSTEMTIPIIPSRHPFTTITIPSSRLPLSQIFPFPSFNSSALNCSDGQIVNLCTTAGLQFFPAVKSPDHQPFLSDFAFFTLLRENLQTIVIFKIKNNRYLSSSYSISASDPELQVNISSSYDGQFVQSSRTLNHAVKTFMFSDNFRDYHSVTYTIHKSRGSGEAAVDFELIVPIDDVVLWRDVVDRGYGYFKEHLPNFVTITGLGHPRNGLANVNMKVRVEL